MFRAGSSGNRIVPQSGVRLRFITAADPYMSVNPPRSFAARNDAFTNTPKVWIQFNHRFLPVQPLRGWTLSSFSVGCTHGYSCAPPEPDDVLTN